MQEQYEHLAELHYISLRMLMRVRGIESESWDELPDRVRQSFIGAMEMMLEIGHLRPGY